MLYAVGCALGLAALTPMLGLCGGGPFYGELLRLGVRMGVSESGLSLFPATLIRGFWGVLRWSPPTHPLCLSLISH